MCEINEQIRRFLMSKRAMEAECEVHRVSLQQSSKEWQQKRYDELSRKIGLANSFMMLLNVEQEFLIRRHLIDGLPWSMLGEEYSVIWPKKDERTLKRIQAKGIRKMAEFAERDFINIASMLDDQNV